MTASFPDSLVREIADRRCLLFVGSGISRQCVGEDGVTRPATWEALLRELMPLRGADERARAERLLAAKRYLDAAEIILAERNVPDYSVRVRQLLERPRFVPSAAHDAIARISPKIIITTNYDTILEQAFRDGGVPDLRVCRYYESHAINVVRSDEQLLLKAHGCITNPPWMVVSRSHYFEAKSNHPRFYDLLNALFLVHTILFVGCSMDDPDIQLVLENAHIKSMSSHPHYAIMAQDPNVELVEVLRKSYNIQVISYTNASGTHQECVDILSELAVQVEGARS